MRSIFIYTFLILSFQSFGQKSWLNLPEEDQAEKAMEQANYPLAVQLYEKALEIRMDKYPLGFYCHITALKEVSKAKDHLIVAHSKAGNYTKHIELCGELSSWSEEGMRVFPDQRSPYLEYGLVQIKIAESYQALGQYDKGLKVCQNLIEKFLNTENNEAYKFVAKHIIPFAHSRAGEILKDQGNQKASVIQHEKSVAAWQYTLKETKDNLVHEEIAKQSKICVQRYEQLKDSSKVIKYAELAMKHYEILKDAHPDNEKYTREVIFTGNTLANYKLASGEYEEVIERYKKSLALNEKQFNHSNDPDYLEQMAAINLKISDCYQSLNNTSKSAQHLFIRIEQLKQLRELIPSTDYLYTISSNQYQLAKKYEKLNQFTQALEELDESILFGQKAIEKDPENIRKKEWQWVQEFFRYQLLRDMEDYKLAHSSLDRLKNLFNNLEKLEPGVSYSEHIKEVDVSQRVLAYPDIVKLDAEVRSLEDGKMKFEKSMALVKLLKKKIKKDRSMQLAYVKHTSELAWTGLMTGEFKASKKALKKAMRIKPVDPYLITNYAPCLLFMGKYKKAEKVYAKNYEKPFRPGKNIIYGFIDDFEQFEENGAIPTDHREKVEEIKAKLNSWNMK